MHWASPSGLECAQGRGHGLLVGIVMDFWWMVSLVLPVHARMQAALLHSEECHREPWKVDLAPLIKRTECSLPKLALSRENSSGKSAADFWDWKLGWEENKSAWQPVYSTPQESSSIQKKKKALKWKFNSKPRTLSDWTECPSNTHNY